MKEPSVLVSIALAVATLGMVLVVLGVVQGGLFFAGVTILTIGLIGAAAAGIYAMIRK